MEKQEIESYRKAGKIAKQVRDYCREITKPGILLAELAEKIESRIIELGGKPAFPVNLSINEIAAHYTPSLNDETKACGLLKIDFGVSVDGYIADTALSFDLTDGEFNKIIELNESALKNVLDNLKQGSKIKDVGKLIQEKIKSTGYSAIINLSGHSLEKDTIHAGITIPNHENNNSNELKDAFAIEPFLTSGSGEAYEGKPSEIFMLQKDAKVRDRDARELLKFVKENYNTKPFCKRWLEKAGLKKLDFLLPLLSKQGILRNYPILVEKSKKPVSQAEHTILIYDKVEVITR